MLLDRGGRENLSAVDEEFGCAPKGAFACHFGLLEQRPQFRLMHLLHRREVLV